MLCSFSCAMIFIFWIDWSTTLYLSIYLISDDILSFRNNNSDRSICSWYIWLSHSFWVSNRVSTVDLLSFVNDLSSKLLVHIVLCEDHGGAMIIPSS